MTLICTIGDLILDVVVLPAAPLARDGDTPAAIHLAAGGQAANVAAWAVHLGARGRLICVRGGDRAAEMAESDLGARRVEVAGPRSDGGGGIVVSTREVDGARTMASDPGAASTLAAADIDPRWVADADTLHVSGYCLLRDAMAEAAITAARSARRVSLDLASANDIALVGAERFAERVGRLGPGLIFANEAERAVLDDRDLAVDWVIKRGPRGASFPEGEFTAEPGTVKDTTGAGDALAAGYLVGGPQLAMAAAARCIARVGAMPEAPGRDEVS